MVPENPGMTERNLKVVRDLKPVFSDKVPENTECSYGNIL